MLFACLSQFSDSKGQRFESPRPHHGQYPFGCCSFFVVFHPVGMLQGADSNSPGPPPASRRARVLNQNGLAYTAQNIDSLLAHRHENKKLLRAGRHPKGPVKRTREQDEAFVVVPGKMLWI